MIDVKKLKELIKLMIANDLTELDLQGDGERVTLKRGGDAVAYPPTVVAGPVLAAPVAAGAEQPGGGGSGDAGEDDGLVPIVSPMVGTYYSRSGPDAKPFLKVGDRITADQVVCLIEAMKVFNEIKAEMSGTVVKILVDDAQAVEFEQSIILIKPD